MIEALPRSVGYCSGGENICNPRQQYGCVSEIISRPFPRPKNVFKGTLELHELGACRIVRGVANEVGIYTCDISST